MYKLLETEYQQKARLARRDWRLAKLIVILTLTLLAVAVVWFMVWFANRTQALGTPSGVVDGIARRQ